MRDDATLLRSYARDRSEADFAELVQRHLNFVYAAALRQVNGDAHLAQDVAQRVFTDLARKAASVARQPTLAGWLFTSTRYAAANLVRGEQRRRAREQEARLMDETITPDTAAADWDRVRPVLDDALAELPERDREAILLRFLQGAAYAEVGRHFALTENAARMRVDRALDKLRDGLARRGVTSTGAALAVALGTQAAMAAPAGLATTITGAAVAGTGGAAAGVFTFMGLTKLQTGIAGAVVLAATGTFVAEESAQARLRRELAGMKDPVAEVAGLRATHEQLRDTAAVALPAEIRDEDWERLRAEAAALQASQREAAARRASAAAAGGPERILPLHELDQMPRPGRRMAPLYPWTMRSQNTSGDVVAEFVIDREGRVVETRIVSSSHPEFEVPTLTALAQWQFEPGQKDGRAVATKATQHFKFDNTGNAAPPMPPDWF
jgi:RNA polymerase sigma factor (sigma-70 family)